MLPMHSARRLRTVTRSVAVASLPPASTATTSNPAVTDLPANAEEWYERAATAEERHAGKVHTDGPSPGQGNMPDQLKSADPGWTPAVSASDTTASSHAPPPPGRTRPFLSTDAEFGDVSRGTPVPHSLTGAALEAAGLTSETWSVSVGADGFVDPPHCKLPARVEMELTLDLATLKQLGKEHGTVKVVKAMQCLNIESPLGQGLWEGVSLATVLRQCRGMSNVRRVNYWGYAPKEDARQVFRSSVSYTEAMEPAAGDPPVMLAWALNGEPLSLERGGPVRMLVPHAHGFKSVKWLKHISLTNDYRIGDTYAALDPFGNDPVSHLKTYATVDGAESRAPDGSITPGSFQHEFREGEDVFLSGVALNGRTPLERVEYWVRAVQSHGPPLDDDDAELLSASWQPATIQPPPADWSAVLPRGTEPSELHGFGVDGAPRRWPLPMSYVGWTATVAGLPSGSYELRARTVDENGNAQPNPRPLQKNGRNSIGCRRIIVK